VILDTTFLHQRPERRAEAGEAYLSDRTDDELRDETAVLTRNTDHLDRVADVVVESY
jgi:hypothetical protein